jgi:hypothetical protein
MYKKLTMKHLSVKKIASISLRASDVPAIMDEMEIPFHSIVCVNWSEYPYMPDVKFRIAHCGSGILLHYQVVEDDIKAVCTADNGSVWEDSCVEFFIAFPPSKFYTNIECNCIGSIHAARRIDKHHIVPTADIASRIERWTSLGNNPVADISGSWEAAMIIPAGIFDVVSSLDGVAARGNFYKCGDNLRVPHFLSWSPIGSPMPNFHLPEFFGEIFFEA